FVAHGTTAGAENANAGSCGGDLAPEVVFTFTAPQAGTWYFTTQVADIVDSYDTLLYARTDCADPASELACDDDGADGPLSLLVLNLEAGATVSVVVDGFRDRSGDFQLTAGLQAALAIGDPCFEDDFASGCPENGLCYSPDGNDPVCTEILTVDVGGVCEPFSPVLICAEGLFCNDLDGDETFNCAEPVIVPEGGVCDPFAVGVDCAEGLVCFDPDEDGTFNCLAPLAAAEGEHCELFNYYYTCAEGLVCSDPEFSGMGNCVAPTIVDEGGACEPDSEVIICAEPAICLDALDDGNYTCVTLTTIEEGGVCLPFNVAAVCVEGTGCVDLDGDGTHTCTSPSPEFAACPPAYGEVPAIDTAGAAPWMIDVDTSMGMHHTNGTCGNGGDANDVAVTFTAPADGEYIAHMVGDFDTVLYARDFCGFPEDVACSDDDFEFGGSRIAVSLVAGQTIYLIADGYDEDASGAATITVEPAAVIQ
ncbi:hypothetical protein L6V77_07860, partial [Myxococcota bacterium]|nr:hypothetical protein [Myxococcota bacterium]